MSELEKFAPALAQMTEEDLDHVGASYDAGFVVLSYIVSLVGCVTTLELLHRRTSRHGAYNWYDIPRQLFA